MTALVKKGSGFRPIAVGEILRHLVSKACCFSACSSLPDLLLPFGQVDVGISGGLEASVHSLHTILSTLGSDSSLCCLKLDMTNAFNEHSHASFCLIVILIYLSFSLGFSGAIAVLETFILGLTAFYPRPMFSRVTLWVPYFFPCAP